MDFKTRIFRGMLLALAGNKAAEAAALKFGMKLGAGKFVAGETMEEAMQAVRLLNEQGIHATLDYLGEGVSDLWEARTCRNEYIKLLEAIEREKLRSNVSLKPTQMGLALDREAAFANIRSVVVRARELGNFVRLDMENSPYTDGTIDIVRRLHQEGLGNAGAVIQASLYRSHEDARQLTDVGISLRLVKGAYKEPENIAYREMWEVNYNFRRLIAACLDSGAYTAVATHDEEIIEWTKAYAGNIDSSRFEFQMLYGIRTGLQAHLASQGYKVRCYVPYGRMWYPYFVRRLAERPANVWFVLKNMAKR